MKGGGSVGKCCVEYSTFDVQSLSLMEVDCTFVVPVLIQDRMCVLLNFGQEATFCAGRDGTYLLGEL